jgi:hypothetical protein
MPSLAVLPKGHDVRTVTRMAAIAVAVAAAECERHEIALLEVQPAHDRDLVTVTLPAAAVDEEQLEIPLTVVTCSLRLQGLDVGGPVAVPVEPSHRADRMDSAESGTAAR